ncbi:MAG: hypothetical protein LBG15_13835 [Dysgonamonadaceae bacterium]|jgi:hypothetical protein|nr:hypothetical protein [Dysgonamonadaceae bacterium]
MFKQLFILLFQLITKPVPVWERLSEQQKKNNDDFYKSYLFPIIGTIALLSFVGIIISTETFNVQLALKRVILQVMIYGGSFYSVSFVLSSYIFPRFDLPVNKLLAERFTGYSSSLTYIVVMILSLFPSFFFLNLFLLYTVYIIWAGAIEFLKIREAFLMKFTMFTSILILLTPFLIDFLIKLLMPGMKN